jgi:hypothetical protein
MYWIAGASLLFSFARAISSFCAYIHHEKTRRDIAVSLKHNGNIAYTTIVCYQTGDTYL